ncbi:hypothetical protein NIA71_08325 [Ihubacter massiliensis]|uniref:hypothetical protein n=1 Tax=Ihubacter massiliensis TaxID=1852367 RepID=UPI002097F096|nr:hypothetical protein [Ihubacter massiliensis]MCO7121955.1 hypothetical protein [Ihubacter massiliensis]
MIKLTKDTDLIFCQICEEFLTRRKHGIDKENAIMFANPAVLQTQFLQGTLESDIRSAIKELRSKKLLKAYIDNSFQLTDDAIIYIENRFKNRLKEVVDIIAKLRP